MKYRIVILGVLAIVAGLLAPASASATTRMGPDLTSVPGPGFVGVGCQSAAQYNPCTFLNHSSANPDVIARAPSAGVITRWRFRGGCCTDPQTVPHIWTLRTIKPGSQVLGYPSGVAAGTGPSFVVQPGQNVPGDPPVDLPARLPIAAGDMIGIEADYPISMSVYNPTANVTSTVFFNGTIYNGEAYGAIESTTAMAINADLEPDADGDGFGDETQDCNPTDPAVGGGCSPAPTPTVPITPAAGAISCPAGSCGSGPSTYVVFSGVPTQPSGPRSDGGIDVTLQCPPNSAQPCGGVLYAELPAALKKSSVAGNSVKRLGGIKFSLKVGEKRKFRIKFSKPIRKFLKKKRKRTVNIVIQPNDGGQPITTRKTLKFKKN